MHSSIEDSSLLKRLILSLFSLQRPTTDDDILFMNISIRRTTKLISLKNQRSKLLPKKCGIFHENIRESFFLDRAKTKIYAPVFWNKCAIFNRIITFKLQATLDGWSWNFEFRILEAWFCAVLCYWNVCVLFFSTAPKLSSLETFMAHLPGKKRALNASDMSVVTSIRVF